MSLNANEKIVAGNADASYLLYLRTEYADTDLYSRIHLLIYLFIKFQTPPPPMSKG